MFSIECAKWRHTALPVACMSNGMSLLAKISSTMPFAPSCRTCASRYCVSMRQSPLASNTESTSLSDCSSPSSRCWKIAASSSSDVAPCRYVSRARLPVWIACHVVRLCSSRSSPLATLSCCSSTFLSRMFSSSARRRSSNCRAAMSSQMDAKGVSARGWLRQLSVLLVPETTTASPLSVLTRLSWSSKSLTVLRR